MEQKQQKSATSKHKRLPSVSNPWGRFSETQKKTSNGLLILGGGLRSPLRQECPPPTPTGRIEPGAGPFHVGGYRRPLQKRAVGRGEGGTRPTTTAPLPVSMVRWPATPCRWGGSLTLESIETGKVARKAGAWGNSTERNSNWYKYR